MRRGSAPDGVFLGVSALLVLFGLIVFMSASFGLLARDGAGLGGALFSQIVLGLVGGLAAGFGLYHLDPATLRKYSVHIFVVAVLLTLLVFIPGIGFEHAGAKRWLSLGPLSFQPAELLKIATVIVSAAWMAGVGKGIRTLQYGLGPLIATLVVTGAILIAQPDNGTFLVLFATLLCMFLIAGGRFLHLAVIGGVAIILFAIVAFSRPYVMDRLLTFVNPTEETLGRSYQLRQSLIAIGSGQVMGKGLGQSIQKFQYLPEPTGDSIFAILGEEFGFVGATFAVILFILFGMRGLRIAARAPNGYTRLLIAGIVIMIIVQSFLNIGAMIGLLPLTGIPLVFISHGGSALLLSIAALGLILGISRHQKSI